MLFGEPISIESSLRPKGSQGSGLIALANTSVILSKCVQEKKGKYVNNMLEDNDEEFTPLEAYRNGYMLDYLSGIKNIENIKYMEWEGAAVHNESAAAKSRNLSRGNDKNFILTQAQIRKIAVTLVVEDMRKKGINKINAQLEELLSEKNRQTFNIDNKDMAIIESCVTKLYLTSSAEEKNLIASLLCLRKVLAHGAGTGAAGWHLWAEKKTISSDILYRPLSAAASVMESLLRPAKNGNMSVYDTHRKPRGWTFLEFDLIGSGDDGRVFMAHRSNAETGDAIGFNGTGDLWVVLIVDPNAHQGVTHGNYLEHYNKNIKIEFSKWKSFGLRNPFIFEDKK